MQSASASAAIRVIWLLLLVLGDWQLPAEAKKCRRNYRFNKTLGKCEIMCATGYKPDGLDRCAPSCSNCPLDRGSCRGPNLCRCHATHVRNTLTGACELAECREESNGADAATSCQPNGQCVAGRCECDPGYMWRAESRECLPVCDFCEADDECQLGTTRCTCWDSYEEQEEVTRDNKRIRKCRPKCEPDCVNGKCLEATTCICNAGHQMRNGSRNHCDPVCSPPCGDHGHCEAPNQCACAAGYAQSAAGGGCEPVCQCGHGRCRAPDLCDCEPGYEWSAQRKTCDPICLAGCAENADCVGPEECECSPGYAEWLADDGMRCRAVCEPQCELADCVQPGKCSCLPGHEFLAESQHVCVSSCEDVVCPTNGFCGQHGICSCLVGFAIAGDGAECQPLCPNGCAGGQCVEPNRCECPEGTGLDQEVMPNRCRMELWETSSTESPTSTSTVISSAVDTTGTESGISSSSVEVVSSTATEEMSSTAVNFPSSETSTYDFESGDIEDSTIVEMIEDSDDFASYDGIRLGGLSRAYWLYGAGGLIAVIIAIVILVIAYYRKIDYDVKRSELKLGVYYNATGSIMAYGHRAA